MKSLSKKLIKGGCLLTMDEDLGNIDMVMAGGEVIKEKGKIIGIDWEGLFEQLVESKERILNRAHKKGFEQAESVAAKIFPINSKSAREQRWGARILQVPVPALHRALLEFMKRK